MSASELSRMTLSAIVDAGKRGPRHWVPWGIVAVLLLAAGVLLAALRGDKHAARYAVAQVELRDVVIAVKATGNLQPTRQVDVGSETSGLITQIYVDTNDAVKKGQTLARLDTARLQDAARQAEAALASADAQVASADATAAQATAQLSRIQEVYRLSDGKVPSRVELDQAVAELRRAEAQVSVTRAQVAQARAQLSSTRTSLSKATIQAPINGVVVSRKVDIGQTVAANFQTPVLFSIAEDLTRMRLDVKVDEADVGQVVAGQSAVFVVDAFPGRQFKALVDKIDIASSSSAASGETRAGVISYNARLSAANADMALRPGMTASAEISVETIRQALVVPIVALRFVPPAAVDRKLGIKIGPPGMNESQRQTGLGRGSRQTLHVLGKSGRLEARSVVIRAIIGTDSVVEGDGLTAGDAVVTGILGDAPK